VVRPHLPSFMKMALRVVRLVHVALVGSTSVVTVILETDNWKPISGNR